jgi:uncharacterized OB-fold protein
MTATTTQIPIVDYLVLGDDPHLVAHACADCGARYFDRRNSCASCGGTEFRPTAVSTTGELRAFTIVTKGPPGIDAPYVAVIVDCDGTTVRGTLIDVIPDPDHVHVGMPVRLTTTSIGTDDAGTEGVGFAFTPRKDGDDGE